MIFPLIHRNGTSAETLQEGYEVAGQALRRALECLQDAAPNARDYYPIADSRAFARARDEHNARIEKLRTVLDDLEKLYEHCHTGERIP